MSVISLRLKDREIKRINELSKMEHKDNSTVAMELIDYGISVGSGMIPENYRLNCYGKNKGLTKT